MITEKENEALKTVASNLGIQPEWLYNIILKESAFNPQAVSKIPYNQYRLDKGLDNTPKYAKGLIQFIDSTAQDLGFKDSQDLINKYPDITSQLLTPVYNYFKREKPFKDENDFYLSVFYPAYRGKPLDTLVSASIQASNPTIKTVGDYIDFIKGGLTQNKFYLMGILLIVGAILIISKYVK